MEKVIEHLGLSIITFAKQLGMPRPESLYQIRKGNFGISPDLADRIVRLDPNIDRTWLLSGIGSMLKSKPLESVTIPFYPQDMEEVMPFISDTITSTVVQVPYNVDCDYVVRTFSRPMSDPSTVANDLFLKRITNLDDMVQGNEYVMHIEPRVLWRKIRLLKEDDGKIRLVARNREDFPDIIVDRRDIKACWRVVARVAILES
ncbi:MAG: hypothetical protein IKY74_01020 [Alistipes sp.]|nr:hypothetical protein [Alistipes sp.]